MRESMYHVLDQGGRPRRLDPVTGHIAYEDGDASFLDLEHVIEVAAHAGGFGGRTVEMAQLERADRRGDVQKRLLEVLGDAELLLIETLVLVGQQTESFLARLEPLHQLLSILDRLREHRLTRRRAAADVLAGDAGQPGGQSPQDYRHHDGRPEDGAAEVGEEREVGRSADESHDHPRQRPHGDGRDHRDQSARPRRGCRGSGLGNRTGL